ncbi:MAG TPA: hypothetical protein VNG51_00175 [Ktedonobacteraceae bacterium]|nr:hypothetical protein [Ktedonobacteraceae bacterium]
MNHLITHVGANLSRPPPIDWHRRPGPIYRARRRFIGTGDRGQFIAPTADLSARETEANLSAVGAINRPLQ